MPLCQPCAGCRPNHCARYTPCMVLDAAAAAVSERLYCSTEAAEASCVDSDPGFAFSASLILMAGPAGSVVSGTVPMAA